MVYLIKIDILHSQSGKAGVDRVKQRLAGEKSRVRRVAPGKERLRRNNDLVPPRHVFERAPGDLFRAPARVDIGCVEKIDACLERLEEERSRRLLIKGPALWRPSRITEAHATKTQ